jgi:transposase
MTDMKTWEERLKEWRGSGLSAEEYCRGKGFSAGTLYRWSSRVRPLRGAEEAATREASVGLVRVVRAPARAEVESAPRGGDTGAVLVEVEGARVVVPPGADEATVAVVLRALRAAGTGR